MNPHYIADIMNVALADKEKHIDVLKEELARNGFKECSDSAKIFLGMMEMSDDARIYWETLATVHLPQHPSEANKQEHD